DQTPRRGALGKQVSSEREERYRRQRGIGGEPVVVDRNGSDGHARVPQEQQRRSADQYEEGRAEQRRRHQRGESGGGQTARPGSRHGKRRDESRGERERHDSVGGLARSVEHEAHRDGGETEGQQGLNRPYRESVGEDPRGNTLGIDELRAGEA